MAVTRQPNEPIPDFFRRAAEEHKKAKEKRK
jgi:hypothetical protein